MSNKQGRKQGTPPPNPMWKRSPARVSKDGRTMLVDATIITYVAEHYRACKLPMPKGWH